MLLYFFWQCRHILNKTISSLFSLFILVRFVEYLGQSPTSFLHSFMPLLAFLHALIACASGITLAWVLPKVLRIPKVIHSEKKLKLITDALPHGIILLAKNKTIISLNPTAKALLQHLNPKSEKNILTYFTEDNLTKFKNLLEKCSTKDPGPFYKNFNFYDRKKSRKPSVSFQMSLLYVEEDLNFNYLVTLTDLTPQKSIEIDLELANSRLYHQTEQLNSILQNMVDAVVTIDDKGIIETLNPAAESLFGYSAKELIGESIKVLMPSKHKTKYFRYLQNYFDTGKKQIFGLQREFKVRHKNGTIFPIYLGISEAIIQGEKKFCGIMRDLTETKKYEAQLLAQRQKLEEQNMQLRVLNQDLEHFNYLASHDLKEPLRNINNYCELIKLNYKGKITPEDQRYFECIQKSVNNMRLMIIGLRDFNKLRQQPERWETINIQELLQDIIAGLRRAYPFKAITATFNIQDAIVGYPELVQILLTNLIDNSIKYGRENAVNLIISLQVLGDGTRKLVIQDDGIGIDKKYQQKVFELFYRLHPKEQIAGAGIGLATCKRIIDMHQGQIELTSTPGKGTTFTLLFPNTEKILKLQKLPKIA